MVFYNTDKEKYFTIEFRFSERMGANELVLMELSDLIMQLVKTDEIRVCALKMYGNKEQNIYHISDIGEFHIDKRLKMLAVTKYLVYKNGKLIQP